VPNLALERTEFAQAIGLDHETTPIGLIARLEHAVDRMETDLEEHRRRTTDAKVRLTGYEARLGEAFRCRANLTASSASSRR
jgi:uncharacterized protein YueI